MDKKLNHYYGYVRQRLAEQIRCFSFYPLRDPSPFGALSLVTIASSEVPKVDVTSIYHHIKLDHDFPAIHEKEPDVTFRLSKTEKWKYGIGLYNSLGVSVGRGKESISNFKLTNRTTVAVKPSMEDIAKAVERQFIDLIDNHGLTNHLQGTRFMFGVVRKVHYGTLEFYGSKKNNVKGGVGLTVSGVPVSGNLVNDQTHTLISKRDGVLGIEMFVFVATRQALAANDPSDQWHVSQAIPVHKLKSLQFERALLFVELGDSRPGENVSSGVLPKIHRRFKKKHNAVEQPVTRFTIKKPKATVRNIIHTHGTPMVRNVLLFLLFLLVLFASVHAFTRPNGGDDDYSNYDHY